jgi:hypothetical protein
MREYILNSGRASIHLLSRHIRIGTEIFEVQNGGQLYLGIATKRFLTKISADILESSVRQLPSYKESDLIAGYASEIRGFISGDTSSLGGIPLTSPGEINDAYYYAMSNLCDLTKNYHSSSITAFMYCVANTIHNSDERNKEFTRQGEYIISSMKSGEWMFYL